jgi:hypothetical protein
MEQPVCSLEDVLLVVGEVPVRNDLESGKVGPVIDFNERKAAL